MGTMANALGTQTTKGTINGKEWTLSRSTWGIQSRWSEWLADRAEKVALATAEKYRDQAAEIWAKVEQMRKANLDGNYENISDEERATIDTEGMKLSRKARIMETEARWVVERYQDRRAAGEYEFHSFGVGQLAQANLPGQIYLIWLCLCPNHPGLKLEEVAKAHMPDGGPDNFVDEWRQLLLKSEGVLEKNGQSGIPASTPESPSESNSPPMEKTTTTSPP